MARKERRQFTLEVLDSFCKEHNIIYDAISDDEEQGLFTPS